MTTQPEPTEAAPGVPEPAPEQDDTSVRPEDGPQDVNQDADYEEAETDDPEDEHDDPAVNEGI